MRSQGLRTHTQVNLLVNKIVVNIMIDMITLIVVEVPFRYSYRFIINNSLSVSGTDTVWLTECGNSFPAFEELVLLLSHLKA